VRQHVIGLGARARDERSDDLAIACLDRQPDVAETILDRVDRDDLIAIEIAQVGFAAELALENFDAVDRHDDGVLVREPAAPIRAQLFARSR
jgi:hypothetical protein